MLQKIIVKLPGRSRVQDHWNPMSMCDSRSMCTHRKIRLQLHHHNFRLADNRRQCCDIRWSHLGIRARHNDNPVLPFSVHNNRGHPCSLRFTLPYMLGIDPLFAHHFKQFAAEGISAHSADHPHICAETGCGCRLIRTLSAWRQGKILSKQCLSGIRSPACPHHHIHI
ncbi:hypothetical protein D3C73_788080 [compost metagenome]